MATLWRSRCRDGLLIALGLSVVPAACHAQSAPVTPMASRQAGLREQLAAAEKRWAASRPEAYQFTIRVLCFCPPEVTGPNVMVVAGGIGRPQAPRDPAVAGFLERYSTVEKLFALARAAIDRQAFRLNLAFDPTLGVPTLIDVDYQEMMADDELRIVVSDFKAAGA